MARSRNIKPGFFKNELLAEMPPETRLLFMGLWCLADREGRFEDRPKKIKMELFPCDDFSIEESLTTLASGGFLIRYEVDGKRYAQVVNFTKHQMPHHKEVASEIPAPPGFKQVTKHAYDVTQEDRLAVFNRDGDKCLKCGSVDDLSLDHIIPLASGGDNSINNLQTLCKRCNSSKGNSTKDHRKNNVDSTLIQRQTNDGASCPSDSLLLIPDSLLLIPDSLKDSEAKASGGKPPLKPDEIIFGYGLPILTNAGTPEKQARSFLGGLRKAHGDDALVNTLRECIRAKPLQPLEWLAKAMLPDATGAPAETRYQRSKREQMERDFPNLMNKPEFSNGLAALVD